MIERIYILENVDPIIFYGVNNSNMQPCFLSCVLLQEGM